MADRQRSTPAGEPPVHPRVPRRHPRDHDPRPPPGPPAERPRQLLPEPRARPERHARRPRPSEDRHHELPRLHAPRDSLALKGRPGPPHRPGRGDRYPRDRRPDAQTRHARSHGPKAHPGPQRRSPPLLPRETARGGRGRQTHRRRPQGGGNEPRGRARVDLGARDRAGEARRRADHRPLGNPILPSRLGLPRRHALPLDGERLLAHGRDRERDRQAPPGAGRGQHRGRRDAEVSQPLAPHRQEDAEAGPHKGRRTRSTRPSRSNFRPPSKPSTATTRRPSSFGTSAASKCPRASSSFATTRRHRSSSTTTCPASSESTRTARPPSSMGAWRSSATSTRRANGSPSRERSSSTAPSSNRATPSTRTSETRHAAR